MSILQENKEEKVRAHESILLPANEKAADGGKDDTVVANSVAQEGEKKDIAVEPTKRFGTYCDPVAGSRNTVLSILLI